MRNKLGITLVLVLCVVAGFFVGCDIEETSQVKDVKMIVAKFNRVGYDRYGRPLSGDNTNTINGVLANDEINKYDKSTTKDGHYPIAIIDENGNIYFVDEKDTTTFWGKVEDTFLYRKFKEKSFWGEGVVRINTLDKPWIKNGRYIQGVFHHKIVDSVENSEWIEVENPNNELIFVFMNRKKTRQMRSKKVESSSLGKRMEKKSGEEQMGKSLQKLNSKMAYSSLGRMMANPCGMRRVMTRNPQRLKNISQQGSHQSDIVRVTWNNIQIKKGHLKREGHIRVLVEVFLFLLII